LYKRGGYYFDIMYKRGGNLIMSRSKSAHFFQSHLSF
jgi:hypothetical protein